MGKERNPRDVDVHEIVFVIETLDAMYRDEGVTPHDSAKAKRLAPEIVAKLVGPERESEARWSSRHIVVDYAYCQKLADSLAISEEEAHDFFIGEPVKRVEKVAAWALETADKNFAGLDRYYEDDMDMDGAAIHGQRGRAVADMLRDWAIQNQTGVYRQRQYTPQATPLEESA